MYFIKSEVLGLNSTPSHCRAITRPVLVEVSALEPNFILIK